MSARSFLVALGAPLVFVLAGAPRAHAQLLSPGRLAEAHSELEGLRNCTSCHELGQRGVSAGRCLGCHEELATRIADGRGYHASVAVDACADCHQDHLGEDFDLRRFDEAGFDHREAGYELRASHASVECRECHQASVVADPAVVAIMTERGALARTFLGLSTVCARCHATDSPHGDQFAGRTCADCHDEGEWARPPTFDHAGTAFPLEGLHVEVACADCHGSGDQAVYTPLAHVSCADCHTDPHAGAMGATCVSCHSTVGWASVSSGNVERLFDHTGTGFPLFGAHASLTCRACHQPGRPPRSELVRMTYVAGTEGSTYPRPLFDSCEACHVEQHAPPPGEVRWTDCESCHSDLRWSPSPFDVERHLDTSFALTGAHAVTPCVLCHVNPDLGHDAFTLSLPGQACVDCHRADDPHGDLYVGMTCEECHDTEGFESGTFDHARILSLPDAPSCASCHSDDDPHGGQFPERDCASCHETETFTIERFDHDATAFPLDGAHAPADCTSCHATEAGPAGLVRYRPLGTECVDCHGGSL